MIKGRHHKANSLVINNSETIHHIQEKFNALFPYLKIEFFKEATIKGKGTAKNKMYMNDMALKDLQRLKKSGMLTLEPSMTVSTLEELFFQEFGLFTQVFRKSGNVWLETSATDNWTLQQQNDEGKSLQEDIKNEKENLNDHDIY